MEKLTVNVCNFGAVSGTDNLQTSCFQSAIDYCFTHGGGEVSVPEGTYICGDIRLRSNVTLHLLANAKILGSLNPKDYLNIFNDKLEPLSEEDKTFYHWIPICDRKGPQGYHHLDSAGSYWNYGLIRAVDAENIAIIGEEGSMLNGQNCYDPEGEGHFRGPHCINMHRCKNINLSGYTIIHSANWAHAIFSSENLHFKNVTILAGHDGIHIRKCDNVIIKDCILKTGDDCIAGFDNYKVHVDNCTFNSACSGFRFGGSNILIENCLFYGPCEYIFRCALTKKEMETNAEISDTARKNMLSVFTYFIDSSIQVGRKPKNIVIRNCTVHNADRFLHLNLSGNESWQSGLPCEDITFENIKADGISMGSTAYGDGTVPFKLVFKNIDFSFKEGYSDIPLLKIGNFGNFVIDNVKVTSCEPEALIECYTDPGEITINKLDCVLPEDRIFVRTDKKFVSGAI